MNTLTAASDKDAKISKLEKYIAQLEALVYQDKLTGVGNRVAFDRDLDALERSRQPFALILLDGNGIKKLNDTQGYAAGDAAICGIAQDVAQTIQELIRHTDCVYRFGGDEFAVLVPCKHGDVPRIVGRIKSKFEGRPYSAAIGWAHSWSGDVFSGAETHMKMDKARCGTRR